MPEFFELRNIDKHFGDNHVVKNVSFGVRCGEIFSLLGPSGCGKTTILRISGGFEEPDSGEIFLDGKNITDAAPNKRKINTVFQNYALFPHMSVFDNIAFGPRTAGIKEKEVGKMVEEMLSIIRLEGLASRKTDTISGGQKQRIAIARALINKPKLLLLDEPLAALDLKLRQYMLLELDRIHDEVGTTFIYVTHDQVEAMTLGDRIVIMRDGFIQQIGTPQEVFNHPANLFVAGFIGTPQMNFFDATLTKKGDKYVATVQGADFELPAEKQAALKNMSNVPTNVVVGVRPVHIHLSETGIPAEVDVSELMGSELHLHVNSNGKDIVIVVPTTDIDLNAVHGSHKPVKYSFKPELMHFFDKETEKNIF